jgi:hypothetical protein
MEAQPQEGRGAREGVRHRTEEQNLEGQNPMSGVEMKQARQAVGGERRREGTKP